MKSKIAKAVAAFAIIAGAIALQGCVSVGKGYYTAGITTNGLIFRTSSPAATNTYKLFLPINLQAAITELLKSE